MSSTVPSVIIIFLALALHIVAVIVGYYFHLWMLEKGSESSNSFPAWWKGLSNIGSNHHDTIPTTTSTTELSNQQIALLHTFSFWLLVVGFLCQWRNEILLIIFVGLILLQRQYPAGVLPESQVLFGVFSYLAWIALLVVTVLLLIWSCHDLRQHAAGGGGEEEEKPSYPSYYLYILIASALTLLGSGIIVAVLYFGKDRNSTVGNCGIETNFVAA